jgi:hypothetical protein
MKFASCALKHLSYVDERPYVGCMSESKHLPRPRDPNQLAKLITDIASGEIEDRLTTDDGRDLAAVLLGRRGGLKGGPARAQSMSSERRSEIAKKAADARWRKATEG